jgi:hypothetical protein
MRPVLTAERLRALLSYDELTGVFLWRPGHRRAGKPAGTVTQYGYRQLVVDGRSLLAHRIAWAYVHGLWPSKGMDHINGDKLDNRISNLREADQSQNMQNMRLRRTNTSGLMGVSWDKQRSKWRAQIKVKRQVRVIGLFPTAEEAGAAYLRTKAELHTFSPIPRGTP